MNAVGDENDATPERISDRLLAVDDALAAGRQLTDSFSEVESDEEFARGVRIVEGLNQLRRIYTSASQPIASMVSIQSGGRFGRFVVRNLIGRGGFGSVFLAFDPLLNREVALKIPHPEALITPELRERFRREAQATAALDHPNVVPVHEAGELGPICFLVSAFVPGGNLAQRLSNRDKPMPGSLAVAWVRQMANGVQHAHARGILHRDLKPANILMAISPTHGASADRVVGAPDNSTAETLTPKITDFGLAKLIDTDSGLTQTGLIVGTPQYMAPEQTTGRESAVSPATDVYSLGVILYELLVGRPPLVAESILETLQLVREVEPLSARYLRPNLPRDIDTICLKCLQKDPARRYASAQELADDLGRFDEGRPILARPVGSTEKVVRWCRRHPVSAALIAALFMSLAGGVSAVFWQWRRAEALAVQNGLERDRSEKNYQRARGLVERLTQLGGEMAAKPGLNKSRQSIYEELLDYYQDVINERTDDVKVIREAARARRQLALIQTALGNRAAASESYRSAIDSFSQLRANAPADVGLRRELFESHRAYGIFLRTQDRITAMGHFATAVELADSLCVDYPENESFQLSLANAHLNWAAARQFDSHDEAGRSINQAVNILKHLHEARPDDLGRSGEYAIALDDLGYLLYLGKRYGEAEQLFLQGLELRKKVLEGRPNDHGALMMVARSYERLGIVMFVQERNAEAEAAFRACIVPLERLTAENPDVPQEFWMLANILNRLARSLERQGRVPETIALYRKALTAREHVESLHPEEPSEKKLVSRQAQFLAKALFSVDEVTEAAQHFRDSLNLVPDDAESCNGLAWILATSEDATLGSPSEAVELATKATRASPQTGAYWTTLGAARLAAGDPTAAILDLEKAAQLKEGATHDDRLLLALARVRLGVRDRAHADLAKAPEQANENKVTQRLRRDVAAALSKDK